MILVDTSGWIEFFRGRRAAARLAGLLEGDEVLVHPWVIGELALDSLGPKRDAVLEDLHQLPKAPVVGDAEVLHLVQARGLAGCGAGWVDCQLLASALTLPAGLWSLDRRLSRIAARLGL